MIHPCSRIGDGGPMGGGCCCTSAGLQIDVHPQVCLGAIDHPFRRAGRPEGKIPYRCRQYVTSQKSCERMISYSPDSDTEDVDAEYLAAVVHRIPGRNGSVRREDERICRRIEVDIFSCSGRRRGIAGIGAVPVRHRV